MSPRDLLDPILAVTQQILEASEGQTSDGLAAPTEPVPKDQSELDRLFEALMRTDNQLEAGQLEDTIWSRWTHHTNEAANSSMQAAIEAIAGRRFDNAMSVLDDLVETHPAWPEAWNKRATLHFLMQQDRQSVLDIGRTLALEPRHFGALCGFAQICLRHNDPSSAIVSFERALEVNPHLHAARHALGQVRQALRPTIH